MAAALARLILALAVALMIPAAAGAATPPTNGACVRCHATRHWPELGTCTECHRGDAVTAREARAHDHLLRGAAAAWRIPNVGAVREGARLRDVLGCRRCHVTGGQGNHYAISLDATVWRRDQDALRTSIRHPATFMPDFGLSNAQADRVIAVLLRDGDRNGRLERYLVRFRSGAGQAGNAFAVRCGPCHRALTPLGPQGVGSAGPNLTGLLGPYYPVADGHRWDAGRLERWLANPRAERPTTTMRPVETSPEERAQIRQMLDGTPAH